MTSPRPGGNRKPSKKEVNDMAVLDLQGMELSTEAANQGGGGSRASLLLCGDSSLSVTTCN
jgi:hypothetical protein